MTQDGATATAERYDPVADTWTATGSMAAARTGHLAVRLPDGQVLVVGGDPQRSTGPVAIPEVYDPATGTWSPTAPKTTDADGTLTVLPDGQALVAGGATRPSAAAERYDPRTNRWTQVADMTTPRYVGETATVLTNDQVLVVGGVGPPCTKTCSPLTSAERYDPVANTWTATAPMRATHPGHSATLLPNGQVLIVGDYALSQTPERYDPASNAWTPAGTVPVGFASGGQTATVLPTGQVLVLTSVAEGPLAQVYDPVTDRWVVSAPPATSRRYHTATRLLSGQIFVVGGFLGTAERYADGVPAACFIETDHCIQGRFLTYWQAHGGLAINGFPLSDERQELLEDGQTYTVQYFERVRMEYHPENQPPYDVLLGQFGRRVLLDRFRGDRSGYDRAVAPVAANPDDAYFPATGHNLGGHFLAYWQANGGLAQFGFPLTEPFGETLDNGQFYTVQYFERARFEAHPENAPPYDVLLGQFGRAIEAETRLLSGSFGALYTTNDDVRARLGRPVAPATQAAGATLAFEHGRMIWRGDQRRIYVLCGAPPAGQLVTNRLPYFDDTWTVGQDPGGGPAPTSGLFLPTRGFGKVWRENQNVQQCLGYASAAAEAGYPMTVQDFERGVLLTADTPEGHFTYAVNYGYACNGCGAEGGYERFPTATP
jgi:hypothetical protein